jgi:hypothetical protein
MGGCIEIRDNLMNPKLEACFEAFKKPSPQRVASAAAIAINETVLALKMQVGRSLCRGTVASGLFNWDFSEALASADSGM